MAFFCVSDLDLIMRACSRLVANERLQVVIG